MVHSFPRYGIKKRTDLRHFQTFNTGFSSCSLHLHTNSPLPPGDKGGRVCSIICGETLFRVVWILARQISIKDENLALSIRICGEVLTFDDNY